MIENGRRPPPGAGAAEIVTALARAGTRALFGLPGGGPDLDVVGAAAAAGLRFVLTHGEAAAAIMAATYAYDIEVSRMAFGRTCLMGDDPQLIFGRYGPGN